MSARAGGAGSDVRAARFAPVLFVIEAMVGLGCRSLDMGEFTSLEWERLGTLSVDEPGAPEILRGLPYPPVDRSNELVRSSRSSQCGPEATPPFVAGYPVVRDSTTGAIMQLSPGAQLGKKFYFDDRFSGVASWVDVLGRATPSARAPINTPMKVACVDCHDLKRAGTDPSGLHVSVGAGWYDVNSQPTVNAAYYQLLYWNGRSDSLWAQAAAVNVSKVSMNSTADATAATVLRLYAQEYLDVFCDAGVDKQRVFVNFAKAIAAYEHTLVRGNSAFDRFMAEGRDSSDLSPSAKRGARLFVGKAGCIDCHNTRLLSDNRFHNIGVPQVGAQVPTRADCLDATPEGTAACVCDTAASTSDPKRKCWPWGVWDGLGRLRQTPATANYRRDQDWSDDKTDSSRVLFISDLGVGEAGATAAEGSYGIPDKLAPALIGAWRTPGLRDVALTGPYMHNGVYATLEEVVWHYNRGGAADSLDADARRAVQIAPLRLTEDEEHDLVEFLKSLTGAPLEGEIVNKPVLPMDPAP